MWFLVAFTMIMQGISSIQAGKARSQDLANQKAMARYRQQVAKNDAKAAERRADFEQSRQVLAGAGIMGSLLVSQSVSGARTDVGGPLRVRNQQAAELELENILIGLEGRTFESKFLAESELHGRQARIFKRASKSAFRAGILGGGAQALGTASRGYQAGVFDTTSTAGSYTSVTSPVGTSPQR